MTIPLAVNFGVSQRAPQQTLPGILGIEAGKSADVAFAQSCPQFRGGLPPRVLRRVREYIEAHLENNVSLEVLAGIAGLSISYFARASKQSEGVAPHDYLMRPCTGAFGWDGSASFGNCVCLGILGSESSRAPVPATFRYHAEPLSMVDALDVGGKYD